MAVFFCLVVVLIVQLSVRSNQNAMEKSLLATQAELQRQLDMEDILSEYYLSSQFIEEFALKVLGYGRDGAKIFEIT